MEPAPESPRSFRIASYLHSLPVRPALARLHWSLVIPLLLALLILLAAWRAVSAGAPLVVTYLNVGQGDSLLVRGPDGFDILIDGGKTNAGPTVVAYLRQQGMQDLDVMLASHNDADHIGGLLDVLAMNDIPVLEVLYNGYPADSDLYRDFATAAANEGAPLQAAQYPLELDWGQTRAYILNPISGLVGDVDQNNASVVVLLVYGAQRLLFPGDLEAAGEAQVLARGTPIAAQVLKVGHHGSDSSTSPDFLAAVQPTEAVISVGENSYGHPSEEVLARLQAAGVRTWRTDINGRVWVEADGVTYAIYAEIMNPIFLPLAYRSYLYNQSSGFVEIMTIFYDGVVSSKEPDEFVELRNQESYAIQLAGWTLSDQDSRVYTFPGYVMKPGEVCRVYTNEFHPEWCGLNWGSGSAVWDNGGECGSLRNVGGELVDEFCYP